METQISTRDYLEQLLGLTLAVGCSYQLARKFSMLRKVFKNYNDLLTKIPDKANFSKVMQNPGVKEYMVISNFTCLATPELFKTHMKMVWNYKTEAHQNHCYPQKCDDFQGEALEGHKHHKIYCSCKSMTPFVSSSLLCNIQAIQKDHIKTKATMVVYGQLSYQKDKKSFLIQPEVFGTNREEIYNAWDFLLGVTSPVLLAGIGFVLGIGSCMLVNQGQKIPLTIKAIKEYAGSAAADLRKKE